MGRFALFAAAKLSEMWADGHGDAEF